MNADYYLGKFKSTLEYCSKHVNVVPDQLVENSTYLNEAKHFTSFSRYAVNPFAWIGGYSSTIPGTPMAFNRDYFRCLFPQPLTNTSKRKRKEKEKRIAPTKKWISQHQYLN